MTSELFELPDGLGDGLLWLPDLPTVSVVVALHGSMDGSRSQRLFEDLARILAPVGVAVVSDDRRPPDAYEQDTRLRTQARDAQTVMAAARTRLGVPVGVFGLSQGAWAAVEAAADPECAYLITVGCSGVSPATQMRYYTGEQLRRRGFGDADRSQMLSVRTTLEDLLRGSGDRASAERTLSVARERPWFPYASLPAALPAGELSWPDMDHDPAPAFAAVTCPALAIWGADEECVPRLESQQIWRQNASGPLTIVDLPECGHWPAIGSGAPDFDAATTPVSDDYVRALRGFCSDRCTGHRAR